MQKYDEDNYIETKTASSPRANDTDEQDSSYDSSDDYEAEETLQTDLNLTAIKHPEVSRTTSDTLAAEFEEYVTLQDFQNYNPGY